LQANYSRAKLNVKQTVQRVVSIFYWCVGKQYNARTCYHRLNKQREVFVCV